VVVRAECSANNAETSRRAVLGASAASVALSAAAGVLPQVALPGAARANTVLSADWEQVRLDLFRGPSGQLCAFQIRRSAAGQS